jgi:hypothetical protein
MQCHESETLMSIAMMHVAVSHRSLWHMKSVRTSVKLTRCYHAVLYRDDAFHLKGTSSDLDCCFFPHRV